MATFKSLVATAFTNGTGGVLNLDSVGDSMSDNTVITNNFGGGPYSLSFVNTTGTLSVGSSITAGRLPTSGGTNGGRFAKADNGNLFFDTITLTGGAPGEGLTHFGLTLIHRQGVNYATTAEATFSGGGTVTTANIAFAAVDPLYSKDTFVGFVAPAGETITRVRFTLPASGFTWFDDLGFITNVAPIPEPGTYALGMLGLLGVTWRYRSKKHA